MRTISILLLAFLCFFPLGAAQSRPRLIVLTDFFKDPDDKQSLIRLLAYSNEFEIEGLLATSLAYGDGSVHPEWIKDQIDDYAAVLPSLRLHQRPGHEYPTPESLKEVVRAGAPVIRKYGGRNKGFPVPYPPGARDSRSCDPPEKWLGADHDTPASEHIIRVVDRDDPRPVWVSIWGGAMDLAQALWKVRHQRTPAETARFVRKLRVYQISWQDTGAVWIWNNFPDLFLVQSDQSFRGLYSEGSPSLRDEVWVRTNISQNHGPLGAGYPRANPSGVKEGDTPSFLYLLAAGLADPEHPEMGGWGGRFRRLDPDRQFYVGARDRHPDSDEPAREIRWTVGRWNEAISHDFAARMDWCVRSPEKANHNPVVHLAGDTTRNILRRTVTAGETVTLDASGSHDPDGDSIRYRWWHYIEPSSYRAPVSIANAGSLKAAFTAPGVERPQTIHVILEATDDGAPPLTAYRRLVVTVTP